MSSAMGSRSGGRRASGAPSLDESEPDAVFRGKGAGVGLNCLPLRAGERPLGSGRILDLVLRRYAEAGGTAAELERLEQMGLEQQILLAGVLERTIGDAAHLQIVAQGGVGLEIDGAQQVVADLVIG